jgi:hypothetical protein
VEIFEECKQRQAELLRILGSLDHDQPWQGDELALERFKLTAKKAIAQYEKILHLVKGEQIGHA